MTQKLWGGRFEGEPSPLLRGVRRSNRDQGAFGRQRPAEPVTHLPVVWRQLGRLRPTTSRAAPENENGAGL